MWARIALLLLLWLLWIGSLAWRAWKRRRTNAALLQGLAGGPSASDKEAQVLAQRFQEAVLKLKAASGATWWGGGRHLYELPWYAFVGAPGSGKTTALLNAGLQFLLTDGDGGSAKLKGVGGTRNCEWWFTQDAVLIDTAGRYATQESDKDVDASAWDNFLALLKKTRPRQPLNGVLLTVNIQDLLQQGPAERQEHAAKLRARLHELQGKLGVRAPVYVLVTKADLIGGFNESFEGLAKEDRDQVWGFTFAIDNSPGADPMAQFTPLYQQLQQRLVEQLVDRLEAERDVLRRSAIFAFPQEFAALQPVLGDFLRQVFSGGGTVQQAPLVRGVYFTSGTQEGSPIDRVMGALGRSFGIDPRAAASRQGAARASSCTACSRRWSSPSVASVRATRWPSAGSACCVLLRWPAWAGSAWRWAWAGCSAARTTSTIQRRSRPGVPALQQAVQALPPPASADVAPCRCRWPQVRDAARLPAFEITDPPLLHGLGLYQGDKLDAGAQIAYQRLLEKTLMPRVAAAPGGAAARANRDNLEQAYEALKAYLMLHTPEQFDAAVEGLDRRRLGRQLHGTLAPEQRAELDGHLLAAAGAGRAAAGAADGRGLVSQRARDAERLPARVPHLQPHQAQYRPVPACPTSASPAPPGRTRPGLRARQRPSR
jgi:type VI secretion system protein ImpL